MGLLDIGRHSVAGGRHSPDRGGRLRDGEGLTIDYVGAVQ